MGGWGFYDDENDKIADFVIDIEKQVLPKKIRECESVSIKNCISRSRSKSRSKRDKSRSKSRSKSKGGKSKSNKGCWLMYETDENKKCSKDKWEYMVSHSKKIYQVILKDFRKHYPKKDQDYDNMVAGIAIYLAREWGGTPIMVANAYRKKDHTRGIKFPTCLPKDFPPGLKKMALQASKNLLKNKDDINRWKTPEYRIKALQDQIVLFS